MTAAPEKSPVSLLCAAIDRALLSDRPTADHIYHVRLRIEAQIEAQPDLLDHVDPAACYPDLLMAALVSAAIAFCDQPQDETIRAALHHIRKAAGAVDVLLAGRA